MSTLVDCARDAPRTTFVRNRKARDLKIALKERLKSVRSEIAVIGCCATEIY